MYIRFFIVIFTLFVYMMPVNASEVNIVYDVTDYGIYPDDGVDDTAGLQAVLDLAQNSDTLVTIFVPKGVYDVSETLMVYSNTHLLFEEAAQIVTTGGDVFRGGHVDENGNPCDNQLSDCTHGMYTQTHDVLIEGGYLTALNRDEYTGRGFVMFSHGKNITIQDMIIDGYCSHAIRFYGCENVSVENCVIRNNPTTYARQDAGAFESIQLGDNCKDASNGYPYPHDDSITKHVVIRDCVFEYVETGIGNHANCRMADDVLIEDCQFLNVGGTHGSNVGDGCGYGIDLSTISHAVIRNNVFHMTEYAYAAICGTLWETGVSIGHTICDNQIDSFGSYGISLESGANAEIYKNIITGSKWLCGVHIDENSASEVHDNVFQNINCGLKAHGDVNAYDNVYQNCQRWNTDELEP